MSNIKRQLALLSLPASALVLGGCGLIGFAQEPQGTVTVTQSPAVATPSSGNASMSADQDLAPPNGEVDTPAEDAAAAGNTAIAGGGTEGGEKTGGDVGGPDQVSLTAFQTPSGNIECAIADDNSNMECLIKEKDWSVAQHPCDLNWSGNLVNLGNAAVVGLCEGGASLPENAGNGKAVLNYDTVNVVGHFSCVSESTGLTCLNIETRAGFTLSRKAVNTF